jgi:hypothetical protein
MKRIAMRRITMRRIAITRIAFILPVRWFAHDRAIPCLGRGNVHWAASRAASSHAASSLIAVST